MKKLFIDLLLLSLCISARAQPVAGAGSIRHFADFQSEYVDARNIDVWLPDDYNPEKKYDVLYLNDGQMLFDSTHTWNRQEWHVDETMSRLLHEKKIRDCMVVGIWNNGKFRSAEYTPQKAVSRLPDSIKQELMITPDEGFKGDDYLRFIVTELKPFIDSVFSTNKGEAHTFIGGSSMGALISWYALCEYPNVFGGAICMSTHWPGIFRTENNPIPDALLNYLHQHLPLPVDHKIYFDYGTATLDAMYQPFQQQADAIMLSKGYDATHWVTKKFPGASHSESSWSARLAIPLTFLLANPAH